ncbi:hypothetical protein DNTS_011365 [Danionella cerebrum]|uniref:Peptidyl-tRNA hydrolase n=1 Tax=Danionella cerebrum TaxID=2873325 RepID=A0A553QWU1_9TELE|nr:hypothetical protein DNTS_011365 [Danionella translucida]
MTSNTTTRGKVWAFVTQSFKELMDRLRQMITRLLNRALMSSLPPPRRMADSRGNKRKMVVGLGNPGMGGTRHSVGMAVLTTLAKHLGVADSWKSDRQVSGEVIVTKLQDIQLVLLRPKLLMNINGVCVAKAANKYSIQPKDILLVHDELDKPLGKFGFKYGGKATTVYDLVCTVFKLMQVMPRVRIGIGRPSDRTPIDRYVLERFSKEEGTVVDSVLKQSADALVKYLIDLQSLNSPVEGERVTCKSKTRTLSTPDKATEEEQKHCYNKQ